MLDPSFPFNPAAILEIAERYTPSVDDAIQKLVPIVRARGFLTRDEFLRVAEWKSPRVRPRIASNRDMHIEEATRIALSSPVEEMRTGALLTLAGVGYPVASTFLHWFHEEQYPILDFRAMEALGMPEPKVYTEAFWQAYVTEWRSKRGSAASTPAPSTAPYGSGRKSSRSEGSTGARGRRSGI